MKYEILLDNVTLYPTQDFKSFEDVHNWFTANFDINKYPDPPLFRLAPSGKFKVTFTRELKDFVCIDAQSMHDANAKVKRMLAYAGCKKVEIIHTVRVEHSVDN